MAIRTTVVGSWWNAEQHAAELAVPSASARILIIG